MALTLSIIPFSSITSPTPYMRAPLGLTATFRRLHRLLRLRLHPRRRTHPSPILYPLRHSDIDSQSHPYTYTHCHSYSSAHGHAITDPNTNRDAHTHRNSYSHSYIYAYSYSYGHSDSHCYGHCYGNSYAHAYALHFAFPERSSLPIRKWQSADQRLV